MGSFSEFALIDFVVGSVGRALGGLGGVLGLFGALSVYG